MCAIKCECSPHHIAVLQGLKYTVEIKVVERVELAQGLAQVLSSPHPDIRTMPTIPKSANREYLEDEVQAEEVDFLLLQEVQDELPPVLTCCGGGKKKHQH